MSKHEWTSWVPIPTDVIRNEDGVYAFRFRFEDLDHFMVAHFDAEYTGCSKCQEKLEDVFGEPCNE